MTCANSFWTKYKINNKRRLWVWALNLFALIGLYPGILTVYFTRIASYYKNGNYKNLAAYKEALRVAVVDGFSRSGICYLIFALAVVIALQGFSYLFSRRKVDMYHSVPVSMKSRFTTIYINGIAIFVIPLLISYLICAVLIGTKGIFTAELIVRILFKLLIDILFFMAVYNITILIVMITGNLFMATVLSLFFSYYVDIWISIISDYRGTFYKTLTTIFDEEKSGISPDKIYQFLSYRNGLNSVYQSGTVSVEMLIALAKLLPWIIIPFILAYSSYKRRPAEMAGNSMAFYSSRLLVKLLVSVPMGLTAGYWVYSMSENSVPMMVAGIVIGATVSAMLAEIAFNMDFKACVKQWGIIIVALLICLGYFGVHYFDVFGYDKYIPNKDEVASFAIMNSGEMYYSDAFDFEADRSDYQSYYIEPEHYVKDTMFLKDTEAILELAKKSMDILDDDDTEYTYFYIYYRLTNGKTCSRMIRVNLDDESNDQYLNRLIGPAFYKEGMWQALSVDAPLDRVLYADMNTMLGQERLKTNDVNHIIELWREDMSKYDYNLVRYQRETGYISITFDNYCTWSLPVYECFDGVNTYLKKNDINVITDITAKEIESIEITHYINFYDDYSEEETYIDDPEQIKIIVDACEMYPNHTGWIPGNLYASEYSLQVKMKPEYITDNMEYYYNLQILNDRLDDLFDYGILK